MTAGTLQEARVALVRERVLEGVAQVLAGGDELTFARVAKAADVPERTMYRHFPTREALLAAVFDWANARVGFEGERPVGRDEVVALIERLFPGFDEIAPVIHELLVAPEGRTARLAHNDERRRSAETLVRNEVPGLDRRSARQVAAALQLLTSAAAWQTLRDVWEMDGGEAADAATMAIDLIIDGARGRAEARRS
jgi:AcrR family transcriptional regulator